MGAMRKSSSYIRLRQCRRPSVAASPAASHVSACLSSFSKSQCSLRVLDTLRARSWTSIRTCCIASAAAPLVAASLAAGGRPRCCAPRSNSHLRKARPTGFRGLKARLLQSGRRPVGARMRFAPSGREDWILYRVFVVFYCRRLAVAASPGGGSAAAACASMRLI